MPPSAVRTTPSMFCSAPVKAPRTWPKNWLSKSVSLMPAQLTGMNGPIAARTLCAKPPGNQFLARTALPFDKNTAIAAATRSTRSRTSRMSYETPTITGGSARWERGCNHDCPGLDVPAVLDGSDDLPRAVRLRTRCRPIFPARALVAASMVQWVSGVAGSRHMPQQARSTSVPLA